MTYLDVQDLIKKLESKDTVEQTKSLTNFYVSARFKLSDYNFDASYVDGANDGGLDFVYNPDLNSYYILQSKFTATPRKANFNEIKHEIDKIFKTIIQENTNKKADGFVNSLRRDIHNPDTIITINWLTTNQICDEVVSETQKLLDTIKNRHNIKAIIDFIPIDKEAIDRAIYDNKHDFVPQTGRKVLPIKDCKDCIKDNNPETSINSVISKVKVVDILKWFKNKEDIKNYLQKNVRGFIGGEDSDKTINFKIAKSFKEQPRLFWYKHNGIIIFVDSFRIEGNNFILINPQIVNGGQTITTIYSVWDKNRTNNDAEVIIRVYRQSYEDSETYERTIEIVSALNYQNKVNPSDLKSNDQVQVNISKLLSKYNYEYLRKREKNAKSATFKIKMVDLAKIFYCCISKRPDTTARGNVENLFEDSKLYNLIFNKNEISKSLNINHWIIRYITAWCINNNKNQFALSSQLDDEYFQYTKFYIMSDIYQKVWDWKLRTFNNDIEGWVGFVQSEYFTEAIRKYSRPLIKILRGIKPSDQTARDYFRSKEAIDDFNRKSKRIRFDPIIKEAYRRYTRALEE
ncbi:MAG: AIPR family protein [Candidatus Saganbacteria bacterium]|nr:AIPR family protein [Candidatus Saganbacteria bacterium]